MAEVPVTIVGVVSPLGKSASDQPFPALISGKLSLTGLSVGGGPIMPPPSGGGEPSHPIYTPPGIWGPPGPWPTPPIYIPGPPVGGGEPPHPAHPIVLPPVDVPPDPPTGPSLGWEVQTYWTPESGWSVAIVPKEGTLVPTPSKK
jgi:hypothetical protein